MANRTNDSPDLHRAIEALQRLTELLQLRRGQLAREAGLSEPQWRILEEVAREDFMPSLFARRRACTPAAVSRTLRQLLEKKLIRASISAADGRQREFVLTPRGQRAMQRLRASRQAAVDATWKQLDPTEVARFGRFAELLRERLEDYARVAGRAAESKP